MDINFTLVVQGIAFFAVAGAEKLIRKEIDGDAHKALLDELAAEI